ncbi:MAG TPA: hypothetical protein VMD77_11475 [Candidatus Baltobacteraceae bacterium]|jgi:hypothetical protein|nr:hypothetical protein [Candidatus Baltobacteraceae bacterium]
MDEREHAAASGEANLVELPASTAWPIVLAFGVMLLFASLVTNAGIGIAGVALIISGCVGWFRQVLPQEHHEMVARAAVVSEAVSVRTSVARLEVSERHRAFLPIESYPVISGLKGGVAGGVAMILPALLYGYIAHHSIWYAVNLLGGAGVAHWRNPTTADIAAFHWSGLLIASVIHVAASLLVGLLYGALLPMWPKHPIVLGGIVAPMVWTGVLHSTLVVINPAFNQRISWPWFAASQFLFGIVAGIVVARTGKIRTHQSVPFTMRMGLETRDFRPPRDEEKKD